MLTNVLVMNRLPVMIVIWNFNRLQVQCWDGYMDINVYVSNDGEKGRL